MFNFLHTLFHQRIPPVPQSTNDMPREWELSVARKKVALLKQIEKELQDEMDEENELGNRTSFMDDN